MDLSSPSMRSLAPSSIAIDVPKAPFIPSRRPSWPPQSFANVLHETKIASSHPSPQFLICFKQDLAPLQQKHIKVSLLSSSLIRRYIYIYICLVEKSPSQSLTNSLWDN